MLTAPAIFLVPGPAFATVPVLGWALSANGLRSALLLIMRAEISVTVSFVLITTTLWIHVLKALRTFGVPGLRSPTTKMSSCWCANSIAASVSRSW